MNLRQWVSIWKPPPSEVSYAKRCITKAKHHEFLKLLPNDNWEYDSDRKMWFDKQGNWKQILHDPDDIPGSLSPNWKGDYGLMLVHHLPELEKPYRLHLKGVDDMYYNKYFGRIEEAMSLLNLFKGNQPLNLKGDILPYGFIHD